MATIPPKALPSAICRRSTACRPITRCGRCGRWCDDALASSRGCSTRCTRRRPAVDSAGATAPRLDPADPLSVRSERQLMEQLDYNLLFRWFVGLNWTSRCGTHHVQQESRPPGGAARSRAVLRAVVAGAREGVAVRRALHRRRDADRSVGVDEELPAQGRAEDGRRPTTAAIRPWISMASGAATTTHAVHDRSRIPADPQGRGQGRSSATGPRADGESPRAGRRRLRDARHRNRRAGAAVEMLSISRPARARWAPTRRTTRAASSQCRGRSPSHPTSPKTRTAVAAPSMPAPPAIPATPSVSTGVASSSESQLGSRTPPCCARPSTAARPRQLALCVCSRRLQSGSDARPGAGVKRTAGSTSQRLVASCQDWPPSTSLKRYRPRDMLTKNPVFGDSSASS